MASSSNTFPGGAGVEFQEFERAMEFLVAQQAQFAADLQQSRDLSDQRHAELSGSIAETHRAITGLTAITGMLVESDTRLGLRMDALAARMDGLAESMDELTAQQKETAANLSAMILVVDQYFRDRNDHGPH
jgi:regulator of replication initiation timing